ncbi:MAG: CpaF family protein [Anaerolineales bacterium]|nr:CpaF family protein [Anaerolineales bacterium]
MDERTALELISPLLDDPHISEILIDNHERVYVEKQGHLLDVPSPFQSNAQIYALIDAITHPLGVSVDESRPFVELRLADNSLVNIVIPPIALTGPSITILKFPQNPLTLDDLLAYNCISRGMITFIEACINARANIIISGATSSGKTTLLSIFSRMIPRDERIVVVQDKEWVVLDHQRLVRLETRPPNNEGKSAVTLRELVGNALRMRPDRIIASNVSSGEVFDLVAAMNSGYDGVMVGMHANNPRDTIDRLEVMAGMGNPSFPLLALRQQLATAINLIVHLERLRDGSRKVLNISEVTGIEDGIVAITDIFRFQQTGIENGKIVGRFTPTGVIPCFMPDLQEMGLQPDLFEPLP